MTNLFSQRLNIGPNQTLTGSIRTTLTGADRNQINGPHIRSYTALDAFPIHEQLNFGHDDIWYTFDSYLDGLTWRSSHNSNSYAIQKGLGILRFNTSPATTAGSFKTWTIRASLNDQGFQNIQMEFGGTLQFNNVGASASIKILSAPITTNVTYTLPFTTLGTPAICVSNFYTGSVLSTGAIARTFTVRLEKHNNVIHCHLTNDSIGVTVASGTIIITGIIPTGYRPTATTRLNCFCDNNQLGMLPVIGTDGTIEILRLNGATNGFIQFPISQNINLINTLFSWMV
jgi:hypothetical protein